jgi:hemerythrin-like metal-binding protein
VPRLTWNDSFALGVPQVDRQHQRLFELLDQLDADIESNHATKAVRRLFHDLVSYSRYHFTTEESLMRARRWPGAEAHAALHREFIERLDADAPLLAEGGPDLAAEFRRFLSGWLVRHIAVADRLAWAAMKEKGLI